MKKDRNCGGAMPYPIYPPYQGMAPGVMPMPNQMSPFMTGANVGMNGNVSSNTIEQQLNTLEQQITLLDKRITNLENMYNSSNSVNYSNNKYNSSNYQMM